MCVFLTLADMFMIIVKQGSIEREYLVFKYFNNKPQLNLSEYTGVPPPSHAQIVIYYRQIVLTFK